MFRCFDVYCNVCGVIWRVFGMVNIMIIEIFYLDVILVVYIIEVVCDVLNFIVSI